MKYRRTDEGKHIHEMQLYNMKAVVVMVSIIHWAERKCIHATFQEVLLTQFIKVHTSIKAHSTPLTRYSQYLPKASVTACWGSTGKPMKYVSVGARQEQQRFQRVRGPAWTVALLGIMVKLPHQLRCGQTYTPWWAFLLHRMRTNTHLRNWPFLGCVQSQSFYLPPFKYHLLHLLYSHC